jgi:hypothetical protein
MAGSVKQKDSGPGWPEQNETIISKITRAKRSGRMAQAIEHLSSKLEALSSNPSTTTRKTKTFCCNGRAENSFKQPPAVKNSD